MWASSAAGEISISSSVSTRWLHWSVCRNLTENCVYITKRRGEKVFTSTSAQTRRAEHDIAAMGNASYFTELFFSDFFFDICWIQITFRTMSIYFVWFIVSFSLSFLSLSVYFNVCSVYVFITSKILCLYYTYIYVYIFTYILMCIYIYIYIYIWPASWSSGWSLWLLIMRSRVRFPALPWEFSLKGKIRAVTMVWVD